MAREITKTVLKAMALTLLSICVVAVVLGLILSFTAPAAMARLTLDLGMYKACAWYDSLEYADGKGDISYIAHSVYCSMRANDEEGVVTYGVQFINDERFPEYSAQIEAEEAAQTNPPEEVYTQYIYGRISTAYYRTEQKDEGLALALSAIEDTFARYNAVTDLVNEVIVTGDTAFGGEILPYLEDLLSSGQIEEVTYLEACIENLQQFTSIGV